MASFLHGLNDFSGFFLMMIAVLLGYAVSALSAIRSELECLHQDFDTVHDAHERHHVEQMSKHGL